MVDDVQGIVRSDFFRIQKKSRSVNPILRSQSIPRSQCLLECMELETCQGMNVQRRDVDGETVVECEHFGGDSDQADIIFMLTSPSWKSLVRSGIQRLLFGYMSHVCCES